MPVAITLECSIGNHLGIESTVSTVVDILEHEAIQVRSGLVSGCRVVCVDLKRDWRPVIASGVDVVLARGQDRRLSCNMPGSSLHT